MLVTPLVARGRHWEQFAMPQLCASELRLTRKRLSEDIFESLFLLDALLMLLQSAGALDVFKLSLNRP